MIENIFKILILTSILLIIYGGITDLQYSIFQYGLLVLLVFHILTVSSNYTRLTIRNFGIILIFIGSIGILLFYKDIQGFSKYYEVWLNINNVIFGFFLYKKYAQAN